MFRYSIRKLLTIIPVLLGISLAAFLLGRVSPGDPAVEALRRIAVEDPTKEQIQDMREEMGLDRPLPEQYIHWLINVFRGDMGESYIDHTSVFGRDDKAPSCYCKIIGHGFRMDFAFRNFSRNFYELETRWDFRQNVIWYFCFYAFYTGILACFICHYYFCGNFTDSTYQWH